MNADELKEKNITINPWNPPAGAKEWLVTLKVATNKQVQPRKTSPFYGALIFC